jgi:hypothetical protein
MKKYQWHFHNEQGAYLTTVVSASENGAKRIFRRAWAGKAKVSKGAKVE